MTLDFAQARQTMVESQVRTWDVLDPRVLDVLSRVHREDFVPAAHRALAFADLELPLGHDEVMMKPVVEGRLLQALALQPGDEVLEIGTGSGFLTACLATLARRVISVDLHGDFVHAAQTRLLAAGLGNVELVVAEAVCGFVPGRRFDAIAVTGALYRIPERFLDWLRPGGRLFAIRGESPAMQAVRVQDSGAGRFSEESLFETDLPYLAHAAPPPRFAL
ncbi:MAG: protein-L-isoaspartate O-methyltransferase [Xanthomonadaceae bacterium]|nr:protein-L-isoaspartate O-methyltransferase [Xanthomonadaceae bacterium]MDE1958745.1 protein-L-isoaspartate O-methyltransferase [Xanthomonadaceae bacterium]MDE2177861.1 protein-L-isoaspartate O-methyltransferase [Xanthomonadaceae bacterium]MDE2245042.1 protein-L-isoaspartate O-methyltransferase [Xanthomonadaceae bacterium]